MIYEVPEVHLDSILNSLKLAMQERDELRALNERLVSAGNVDELRAEVERGERRFRETEAEWVERFQALEAEIERLTRRSKHYEENWKNAEHVISLRDAEVERLRAALKVARFYVAIASERTDRNVYADLGQVDGALVSDKE